MRGFGLGTGRLSGVWSTPNLQTILLSQRLQIPRTPSQLPTHCYYPFIISHTPFFSPSQHSSARAYTRTKHRLKRRGLVQDGTFDDHQRVSISDSRKDFCGYLLDDSQTCRGGVPAAADNQPNADFVLITCDS